MQFSTILPSRPRTPWPSAFRRFKRHDLTALADRPRSDGWAKAHWQSPLGPGGISVCRSKPMSRALPRHSARKPSSSLTHYNDAIDNGDALRFRGQQAQRYALSSGSRSARKPRLQDFAQINSCPITNPHPRGALQSGRRVQLFPRGVSIIARSQIAPCRPPARQAARTSTFRQQPASQCHVAQGLGVRMAPLGSLGV